MASGARARHQAHRIQTTKHPRLQTLFSAPLFPRMQTCLRNALRGMLRSGWSKSLANPSADGRVFPRVIEGSCRAVEARDNRLHPWFLSLHRLFDARKAALLHLDVALRAD